MPMSDRIVEAIKGTLEEIPALAEEEGWTWERGRWTREVKERLCAIARKPEFNFGVCASDCSGADFGEWLYDVCWYEPKEGVLRSLPLVVESEWSPDESGDSDFDKLLQARADLKVWIFEAKTSEAITSTFVLCEKALNSFTGAPKGDRYLLAGVGWNPRRFEFKEIVKTSVKESR